ncbi:MAG: RNA methyltransferase [Chloroflexota bacterium]|nr:RNA methyltransferase [Anaerolineae bacterium]HMM28349.1 RNA methyltransferase [Aggregatilineaceae bacterium]
MAENEHADGESGSALLEGFVSVRAALKAGSRPIHAILVRRDKWDRGIAWLEHAARDGDIPFERADATTIDAAVEGTTHGGVIARVGPRRFAPLEALGAGAAAPFVAMLDGVEDPFNFGQAVRALYAAGAHGLVVRPRNWLSAAGIVARASAGASEWMPTAVAETALDAAAHFRARGLTIACTAQQGAMSIYEADLSGPLFLVIGGERRGITRSFLDQADLLLEIPYAQPFDQSLGTTAATAVLAFEVMRQRAARIMR